jgi:hypothetical protein
METTAQFTKPDRLWYFGLFLLAASAMLFCWPGMNTEFLNGIFFANYALVLVYAGFLLFGSRYLHRGGNSLAHIFLCLDLALISCYSLNRGAPLFETAVSWWAVLLTICCINYLTLFFFEQLPTALRAVICFIMGVGLMAFLYLAFYLAPTYLIGAFAAPLLGISVHLFVPALFVNFTVVFIIRTSRVSRRLLFAFVAGALFAVGFTVQYAVRWNQRVKAMDAEIAAVTLVNGGVAERAANGGAPGRAANGGASAMTAGLPDWIRVAQHCSPTPLDYAVLSADIFYTSGENLYDGNGSIFWMPRTRLNKNAEHDPLVVIGSLFSGTPRLTEPEKLNILRAVFAARHETQRRNWNGDDLVTADIATDVQLWPEQHLSYTEEAITIVNGAEPERWSPSGEEALYTFHLPEGGVVSALSLWIDDKEEKGVLTTRQKADSAYQTIVGSYRRDPSVVHWQEGNTVTVKVYPVMPGKSRRFKLGITAPLELDGSKLVYHNIGFDGPSVAGATAAVRVLPMQALIEPEWPAGFQSDSAGHLRRLPSLLSLTEAVRAPVRQNGSYVSQWVLQCKDPGIRPATFSFNGAAYTAVGYTPAMEWTVFRQFYLDINSSWTTEEYESVLSSLRGSPVYASGENNVVVEITADNKDALFEAGVRRQFSLFPLYAIADRGGSLLISKCRGWSPNFSDLHGTEFAQRLGDWLEKGGPVHLFMIGGTLSSYLRGLKEAGVFRYQKGDVYTLQSQLHHRQFPADVLGANEVLIEPAGLVVRRDAAGGDSGDAARGGSGETARGDSSGAVVPGMMRGVAVGGGKKHGSVLQDDSAPDHLLRLFAYRRILQQLKSRLPGEFPEEELSGAVPVRMAQEAGIVSPVSSYVVLEKKADYDAFDIHSNLNGLQNASLNGKGAVPEPGEWAILVGLLGFFLVFRYYRLRKEYSTNQ